MKLPLYESRCRLLTPCFCGGADHEAELRPPSIRGQVRFWHEELFGLPSMNRVWGAVGDQPNASQIALHTEPIWSSDDTAHARLLPHANLQSTDSTERAKANSFRDALKASDFHLVLRWLPARPRADEKMPESDWQQARSAVRLWLLVGSLGLRSNRAAGSVWPASASAPPKPAALAGELQRSEFRWHVWLGQPRTPLPEKTFEANCEFLRTMASDTADGHPEIFGGINPRVSSPLRFKVVAFGESPVLLILAQNPVTINRAKRLLISHRSGRLDWQPLHSPTA